MGEQYFYKERLPPLSSTSPLLNDPFQDEPNSFEYFGSTRNVLPEGSLWENIYSIESPRKLTSDTADSNFQPPSTSTDVLCNGWVAYQCSRIGTADCDGKSTAKNMPHPDEASSYEEQLSVFGTFDTYTGFVEIWNRLYAEGKGFQLFKTGIKPIWEAEENKDGGKFYIVNNDALPEWVPFALARAVICRKLDFYDNITGIAFSHCTGVWHPQVWCTSTIANGPTNDAIANINTALTSADECTKDKLTGITVRFKKHPISVALKKDNYQEFKGEKQNTLQQSNLLFFNPTSFQRSSAKKQPYKCATQQKKTNNKPYELRYGTFPHHEQIEEYTTKRTTDSPITTSFAPLTQRSTKLRKESPQTFDFSNTNFVFRPPCYSKTDIDVPSQKESSAEKQKSRPRRASFSSSSSNLSEESWSTDDEDSFKQYLTSKNSKSTPIIDIDEHILMLRSPENKIEDETKEIPITHAIINQQRTEAKQKQRFEQKKLANHLSKFALIDNEPSSQTHEEPQITISTFSETIGELLSHKAFLEPVMIDEEFDANVFITNKKKNNNDKRFFQHLFQRFTNLSITTKFILILFMFCLLTTFFFSIFGNNF